jgi:hypothetical protein
MSNPMYLLDFRSGVVKKIDDAIPPRGVRNVDRPEDLPRRDGFVLAALGTPPEATDKD